MAIFLSGDVAAPAKGNGRETGFAETRAGAGRICRHGGGLAKRCRRRCERRRRCLDARRLCRRRGRVARSRDGGRCRCAVQPGAGLSPGAGRAGRCGGGGTTLCPGRGPGARARCRYLRPDPVPERTARSGASLCGGSGAARRSAVAISAGRRPFQRRPGGEGLDPCLRAADARQRAGPAAGRRGAGADGCPCADRTAPGCAGAGPAIAGGG